jgi:hypothetical protein
MASAQATKSLLTVEKLASLDYQTCINLKSYASRTNLRINKNDAEALGIFDPQNPVVTLMYNPTTEIASLNFHRLESETNCINMAHFVVSNNPVKGPALAALAKKCTLEAIIEAQNKFRAGGDANLPSEWKEGGILRSAWNETFGKNGGCPFVKMCNHGRELLHAETPHFGTCVFNKFMTEAEFEATLDMRKDLDYVMKEISNRLTVHELEAKLKATHDSLEARLKGLVIDPSAGAVPQSAMEFHTKAKKMHARLSKPQGGDASTDDEGVPGPFDRKSSLTKRFRKWTTGPSSIRYGELRAKSLGGK